MEFAIHLTDSEIELLTQIVMERQKELTREISHTGHRDFRMVLRDKHAALDTVLARLESAVTAKQSC